MSSSALVSRPSVPASEVVTALRHIESGVVVPGPFSGNSDAASRLGQVRELRDLPPERQTGRHGAVTLDTVIRDIADLRIAVRHAFIEASPEYQLLIELSDNGLRDCAKCVRELEARAAQHPYNKMLTKIDAAYDAAVRSTRAGLKP